MDNKKEIYKYRTDNEVDEKVKQDKELWVKLMKIISGQPLPESTSPQNNPQPETVLFLIKKRLGRIAGMCQCDVRVSVNYWPNGRTDKDDKEMTPYLLSHHFRT